MTGTAHNRPLFLGEVAAFAVFMKCLSQAGLIPGILQFMAIGAALVFGRFVFHYFSVFIDVMAFVAFFYLSRFVVRVMLKDSRGTLSFCKADVIDRLHIFLGECRYQPKTKNQGSHQQRYAFYHGMVSICRKVKRVQGSPIKVILFFDHPGQPRTLNS
jgi:hypothetical protein